MKKIIYAILKVLQGNIQLTDGTDVRLIQSPPVTDHTPCITIDDSSNTRNLGKYFTNKDMPLPVNHPQYNQEEPDKLWSQQVIAEKRGIDIDINIWCNTEDEREEIINQVRTLFYLAQSDNYRFCQQYNKETGKCSTLDTTCPSCNTPTDKRGAKYQCINPEEYKYANIFTTYDIVRASFDVEPAYNLDEMDHENMILRSVIRVSCDYYDYHRIGGKISESISNQTE